MGRRVMKKKYYYIAFSWHISGVVPGALAIMNWVGSTA